MPLGKFILSYKPLSSKKWFDKYECNVDLKGSPDWVLDTPELPNMLETILLQRTNRQSMERLLFVLKDTSGQRASELNKAMDYILVNDLRPKLKTALGKMPPHKLVDDPDWRLQFQWATPGIPPVFRKVKPVVQYEDYEDEDET